MLAKWMISLEAPINRMEKEHPFISMISFQIFTAIAMVAIVGGIALGGGMVIWLFYHIMGVL